MGPSRCPHGFPVLRWISLYRRAVVNTPVARWALIARGTAYSNRFPVPSGGGLPHIPARQGRRPHWTFRGLLNVHSRYGLSTRCTAMRYICLEGSGGFVTSTAASIATGWSDPDARRELHPLKIHDFSRRTPILTPRLAVSDLKPILTRMAPG